MKEGEQERTRKLEERMGSMRKDTVSIFYHLQPATVFMQVTCSRAGVFLYSVPCKYGLEKLKEKKKIWWELKELWAWLQPQGDLAEAKATVG